jgi:ABC-type bacteriocin/lantibiotic exporter with double-glycine peptidase domain
MDHTGCGVACIAMLAGCSYLRVKKVAVKKFEYNNPEFYTTTGQLRKLAKTFGVRIISKRRKRFKDWDLLPDIAILSINSKENNKYWHWVVFARQKGGGFVLDPNKTIKTNRRTDFGRMNPSGYLIVEKNVD